MQFRRSDLRPRATAEPVAASELWLAGSVVAVLAFSSWAFGGMEAWESPWLLALAATAIPALFLSRPYLGRTGWWPMLPTLLWVLFAGGALLNPSYSLGSDGRWLPRDAWVRWLPTTADPAHTLDDAPVWLAALLLGAVLRVALRRERVAYFIWAALAVNGFVLAVVGAFFWFEGENPILGAGAFSYSFASFFYKNHWAAYGALTAAAGLALALRAAPRALSGHPRARGEVVLFGGVALMTLITLPLPGSRSGLAFALLLLLGAGGTLVGQIIRHRQASGRSGLWIGGIVIAVAGLVYFGGVAYAPKASDDYIRTRQEFAHDAGAVHDVRPEVTRDTWHMAQARPWLGWGPGCFELVFPVYAGNYIRDQSGKTVAHFEFAHDDWMQLLAECGFIGAAILIVPALLAAGKSWRESALAGRFVLLACGMIALYAWADFPFHNPAVLLAWTVLLTTAGRLAPRRESL